MTTARQLMQPGHSAGDLLDAPTWRIVEEKPGWLEVDVDLLDRLKNPAGQLFGGFTPTYVDLVAIFTIQTLESHLAEDERPFVSTINMRCDYFEPIVDPVFRVRGEHVNQRGRNHLVSVQFFQGEVMAAYAITTMRELDMRG